MRVPGYLLIFIASAALGQSRNFAGGLVGVSTLSADGKSTLTPAASSASSYKPENGFTGSVFMGRHLTDYVSFQVGYGWNGNDVALTSLHVAGGVERSYEQARRVRQHTGAGEIMLYFRPRTSWVRPYLAAGPGITRLSSEEVRLTFSRGGAAPPPSPADTTGLCFRVAVGIDARLTNRLSFRFTFAETLQGNAISKLLDPPGGRNLANFQNLFGFSWRF